MKKSLLIIATAALVISCANESVRNDVTENEFPIGFTPSFMEKSTRANAGEMAISPTNTFNVDGNTFEVWGWVSRTAGLTKIFNEQRVEYQTSNLSSTSSTGWGYTPLKYWDRTASYMFYAAAPYDYFTLVNSETESARIFSATNIDPIQVLQDSAGNSQTVLPTDTRTGITKSSAIDYLVAAVVPCSTADQQGNDANDKDVAFTFSHILSKLTVRVLTTSDFSGANKPIIKLTNLKIKLNHLAQNYEQKTAGIVAGDSINKDIWTNPTTTAEEITCFALGTTIDSLLLETTPTVIASYFVTPTTTGTTTPVLYSGSADVTVVAEYSVYYTDGVKDHCTTPETTVAQLKKFVQNTSNILNITVSPQAILFDVATVNGFDTGSETDQDVH